MIEHRAVLKPCGASGALSLCALPLALALILPSSAAEAQGLRGSMDTLRGAPAEMSPHALGPAQDTAFELRLNDDEASETPENDPFYDPIDAVETGAGAVSDTAIAPSQSGTAPAAGRAQPQAQPAVNTGPLDEQNRRRRDPNENPYEQLGIRAGGFLIKPSLEVFGGYETNPGTAASSPEGSAALRVRGEVAVESDWTRHALRGRIEVRDEAYEAYPDLGAPAYAADAALRVDARRDLRLDFALRGAVDSDTRDDRELIGVTTSSEYDNTLLAGSGGFIWKPNRISIGLTGEGERRDYGDPDLADRDYTQSELRLRTGYELSPALEPFVEASLNERTYDQRINDGGVLHDSKGYRVYTGARFDPNPIWAFEGKIGYGFQEAEDANIPDLSGLLAEGTLIWRPSVLTQVHLNAARDFEASTVECCAIASRWRAGAAVTHEFRRWLVLTGDVRYEQTHYELTDYTLKDFTASLALEYKFDNRLSAIGRVAYEKLDSSLPSENYDSTRFEVGVRLQR